MKTRLVLPLLMFALSAGPAALAAKMDAETQTSVIERIERILTEMEKKDSSYVPTSERLADLLAERARLRSMAESDANCKGCKGSEKDRKTALRLYEEIQTQIPQDRKARILLQMAHLHSMAGDDKKALSIIESILKETRKHSTEMVLEARVAAADFLFRMNKNKEALAYYQIALKDSAVKNKGVILYQTAWCEANLDHLNRAINILEELLRSAHMIRQTPTGVVADTGFQGDVLRDLATFYAQKQISQKDVSTFSELAPANQRKSLLMFFASEADRVGQKQAAADIYKMYLKAPGLTEDEKLEVYVLIAQVSYDKGNVSFSLQNFALAATAFKDTKCEEDKKCLDLQKRMKHYVTELHRSKKTDPNLDVVNAYALYARTFPSDTEMGLRGALVAREISQPKIAIALYHQASDNAKDAKSLEMALVGEVESAENAKDFSMREAAYAHYLAKNSNGPRAYEVRYQSAYMQSEKKDWKNAAAQFRALALSSNGPRELRRKSADLALDALASENNHPALESTGIEFARAFPEAKAEYLNIARKAATNQIVTITNDQKASHSDLQKALNKMRTLPLVGMPDTERKSHFRNQEILAGKVGDDTALFAALNGTLAMKISDSEREETLARKVGAYERLLDFKSAYSTALKMKFPKLKSAQKELRLGTLADLGELHKATKHYELALRQGLTGKAALGARSRLVMLSANPVRELRRQQKDLEKNPALLSETLILVYGQTHDLNGIQPVLSSRSLRKTTAVTFLEKQPFLAKQKTIAQRLAKHELQSNSDRALQKSIQTRLGLLREVDQNLDQAVKFADFTSEMLALSLVANENERMVKDLARLPIPKGLSETEQASYQKLMMAQSRPYLVKAKMAQAKMAEMWKNETAIERLAQDYRSGRPEIRSLLEKELRTLSGAAPTLSKASRSLSAALNDTLPSRSELLSARENVRENPAQKEGIEKLKILETKIGHPLMSSYLDGRLEQIQREKVL